LVDVAIIRITWAVFCSHTLVSLLYHSWWAEAALHTRHISAEGVGGVGVEVLAGLLAGRAAGGVLEGTRTHVWAEMVVSPLYNNTMAGTLVSKVSQSSTQTLTITSSVTAASIIFAILNIYFIIGYNFTALSKHGSSTDNSTSLQSPGCSLGVILTRCVVSGATVDVWARVSVLPHISELLSVIVWVELIRAVSIVVSTKTLKLIVHVGIWNHNVDTSSSIPTDIDVLSHKMDIKEEALSLNDNIVTSSIS
jgi:hypothetical protein